MRKLGYHYLSMARSNYKDYISGKTEVSLKKYLYALRPLICLLWLEQQGNPPPTDFVEARNGTDFAPEIRARIDTMIARKSRQGELGAGPAEAILDAFIVSHLERFERLVPGLPDVRFEVEPLNRIAWDVLEVAGR
jgi:predicted nucleotidyltransferase